MIFAAGTDRGLTREINEDSYNVIAGSANAPYAFIIADGMGGHNCGEIASKASIEYISESIACNAGRFLPVEGCGDELRRLVEETNTAVYKKSLERSEANGMGTTLTMALVSGESMTVAHVGDSRLYMERNGKMQQLTTDHSYIEELVRKGTITREEAEDHPHKNVITRAVGCMPELEVDILSLSMEKGDMFLLCTDGLTNMVSEHDICEALKGNRPEIACEQLIEAAKERGGEDNITVILIKYE